MDIKLIGPQSASFETNNGLLWEAEINGVPNQVVRIKYFKAPEPRMIMYTDKSKVHDPDAKFTLLPDEVAVPAAKEWKKHHIMHDVEIEGPTAGKTPGLVHLWHDDLRFCEFHDVSFSLMKFNTFDVSRAHFDYCYFKNVDFSGVNMPLTGFRNCRFDNCNVDKMDISAAGFYNCHFKGCTGKALGLTIDTFTLGGATRDEVNHKVHETFTELGWSDKELFTCALKKAALSVKEIRLFDVAKSFGISHLDTRDVIDCCNEVMKDFHSYKVVKFIDGAASPDAVNSLFMKGVLTECQYEDKNGNIEFPKPEPEVNIIQAYLNWTGLGPQPNFAPMPADINDEVTIFLPVGAKVITTKSEEKGIELANGYLLPVTEICTAHRKDGSVQPYIVDCSGSGPKNIYLKYQKTLELKKHHIVQAKRSLKISRPVADDKNRGRE